MNEDRWLLFLLGVPHRSNSDACLLLDHFLLNDTRGDELEVHCQDFQLAVLSRERDRIQEQAGTDPHRLTITACGVSDIGADVRCVAKLGPKLHFFQLPQPKTIDVGGEHQVCVWVNTDPLYRADVARQRPNELRFFFRVCWEILLGDARKFHGETVRRLCLDLDRQVWLLLVHRKPPDIQIAVVGDDQHGRRLCHMHHFWHGVHSEPS
mmetsp:Transcript_58966/g.128189  ORF Transcript_58966/g.128189 Transcript_58966/m.128189 type:complete len:209 (-) Transcript_58966:915-1541(-)